MNALTNRPRIKINRLVHELPNLHEEIIEEILIRLPVKSLGRFRCVSKSWNSLIASRRFIKAHIEKSSANASFTNHKVITILHTIQERSLLSLLHGPSVRPVEYSFPTRDPYDIVGSCDGLLCLLVNEIDFIIWNPSTKKFTRLPSIVDGDLELVTSGFGYDESTDDYKVFGLLRGDKSKDIAKVYSLKTDSWRIVDIAIEIDPLLFISYYGNYFSGKLHWSRCVATEPKEQWEITTFDLENENFGLVELPNNTDYGSYQPSFVGALDGSLCMVCDHGTTQFDVWIKKHHESWYKMAVVSHPYALLMEPLFVGGNGEILFADGLSCSFVVYHPKDDRSSRPQLIDHKAFMGVHVYMESLVSAVPHVQLLMNS